MGPFCLTRGCVKKAIERLLEGRDEMAFQEGDKGRGWDCAHPVIDANSDALGENGEGDLLIIEFFEGEKVIQGWGDVREENRRVLRWVR